MTVPPGRLLEWDSAFFGIRTARSTLSSIGATELGSLINWCEQEQISWLQVLVDSGESEAMRQLEASGFAMVDIRVTMEGPRVLGAREVGGGGEIEVRCFEVDDLDPMLALAARAFGNSRFFRDPWLPKTKAEALYQEWFRKSCSGELADMVLVASKAGAPIGFVTGRTIPQTREGQIGLLAVRSDAKGSRAGTILVREVLQDLHSRGAASFRVVTQGQNVAAIRLYERCGFRVESVCLWYHKWFDL